MRQSPLLGAPPCESTIAAWYSDADSVDSYSVRLVAGWRPGMRSIAEAAFANPPLWYRTLIVVRDGAMSAFGVKSSSQMGREVAPERRVGFMPVHEISTDEIVLGGDDRHLDFRLSFLRRRSDDGDQIIATTVVRCHNLIGRVYIRVILPFHHLVVQSIMARLAGSSMTP